MMMPEEASRPENGAQPRRAAGAYDDFYDRERCRICEREAICGGIGWFLPEAVEGEPRPSQPLRCPNYPPMPAGERRATLLRLSNLSALTDKRFTNFETNVPAWSQWQRERMRDVTSIARQFAELPLHPKGPRDADEGDWDALLSKNGVPMDESSRWLLLRGEYGSGKTHLAAAIGNRWLERGGQVLFLTSPDLLDYLRSTFGPSSEIGYDQLFQRVRNVSLLVLDDFGTEFATPWAREKLFQLLNHRYVHRLPTVLTTNTDLDELDGRLRSRLLDTELVSEYKLPVPDYRNPGRAPSTPKPLQEMLNFYPDYRFDGFFHDTGANPEQKESLKAAKRRAQQYARAPQGWLLFIGGHGSGKTHLAAAIVHELRHQGQGALFASVADLLDHLRSTFDVQSGTTLSRLFPEIRNTPLLVLDGLGHESSTNWGQEKIFQILDHRHMHKLPTIITSALAPEQHSEKLRSRLFAAERVEIHVTSYFERVKPPGQSRLT